MKSIMFGIVVFLVLGLFCFPNIVVGIEYDNTLEMVGKTGEPNWYVVPGGASGTLHYNDNGGTFDFAFEATGLKPRTDYELIYYADPWLSTNKELLGEFTTDASGVIPLTSKSVALNENLPNMPDDNMLPENNYLTLECNGHLCNPTATQSNGAKIWLVLANDYDEINNVMTGWNPSNYLFELDLITYRYEPSEGMPAQGTILPAVIGIEIKTTSLDFGTIKQGSISESLPIEIENTGDVPIKVSTYVVDDVMTVLDDCLEMSSDDINWYDSEGWSYYPISVGETKTVYARLNVPPSYPLGSFSGTVFFLVQIAP